MILKCPSCSHGSAIERTPAERWGYRPGRAQRSAAHADRLGCHELAPEKGALSRTSRQESNLLYRRSDNRRSPGPPRVAMSWRLKWAPSPAPRGRKVIYFTGARTTAAHPDRPRLPWVGVPNGSPSPGPRGRKGISFPRLWLRIPLPAEQPTCLLVLEPYELPAGGRRGALSSMNENSETLQLSFSLCS